MTATSRRSTPESSLTASSGRLLEAFIQIGEIFNSSQNFSKRLENVLSVILAFIGVEQGSIMTLEKGRYLEVQASSRRDLIGHRQTLSNESAAAWVVHQKKPLFVEDISKDPRFKAADGKRYKKNAFLSIPVVHQNKVLAVINATDKVGAELLKDDTEKLLRFSSFVVSFLVQQKLQEELTKQRNTLTQRNKELRRQQSLRDELSRLLIHDLKGPLAEVVANLDILSYSIGNDGKEFLEAAQIACDRTVRMISNLVTIGKIEDGRIKLIKEDVDPAKLLAESVSSIKGLAKIRNIRIHLDCPPDLPSIKIDRVLILRVLQNLMTNGLGYSENGSSLTIGCRKLSDKKRLEFFVQDSGQGIPKDQQKVVFEKYARISDRQNGLVGTGLGLYYCRLAVQEHQGRISVTSDVSKGSRFVFTLPV